MWSGGPSDIDGEWIRIETAPAHYCKRLSTETAWHVYDPTTLREVASKLVTNVDLQLSSNELIVHYSSCLDPCGLEELRGLLNPGGPLSVWRAATVARNLTHCLSGLHELDLPQMLIHPGRIGRVADALVLVPTLPGALPPLAVVLPGNTAGWIHYIAPEILRTRALDRELLFRGDIYSLGRTLAALCVTFPAEVPSDPFALALQRVETAPESVLGELPPALRDLQRLIGRMCAVLPEQRPELAEIITELDSIIEVHAPEQISIQTAPGFLEDFRDAVAANIFHVTDRRRHIVIADAVMRQQPPDCGRAVLELEEAESANAYEPDVQLRLGRVYAVFTNVASNLVRSAEAYERAARLSGWEPSMIAEWLSVLSEIRDDAKLLALTKRVPSAKRPAKLVERRVVAHQNAGNFLQAWYEVADYLAQPEAEPGLKETALAVARQTSPEALGSWLVKVGAIEAYRTCAEIAARRLMEQALDVPTGE
jgi:hypothetical protein